jgi:hypothetical protein
VAPSGGRAGSIAYVPFSRKRRGSPEAPSIARGFALVAGHVDRAKAALLESVPSPRGVPGRSPAEALLEFEGAIRDAVESMDGWRAAETEGAWNECRDALGDALAGAERLRLEAPPLDYESLVTVLGDLMDPLHAFDEADRLVAGHGRR